MEKVRLEAISLEEFREILKEDSCIQVKKSQLGFIDECIEDENLYYCEPCAFKSKSAKQRNSDFFKCQKKENDELEKLLDEIFN